MLDRLCMLSAGALGALGATALMFSPPARADAPGTIVDVACGAGTFKNLVAW